MVQSTGGCSMPVSSDSLSLAMSFYHWQRQLKHSTWLAKPRQSGTGTAVHFSVAIEAQQHAVVEVAE